MSIHESDSTSITITTLRSAIKKWEADFRAANGKRKPGRADIKSNATIAAKYKQYERLVKQPRNDPSFPNATPRKSSKQSDVSAVLSATPRRTPSQPQASVTYLSALSPAREVDITPAHIRNALGPTPQRDGQVLGIFDMLSTGTPSKDALAEQAGLSTIITGTPSKAAASPAGQLLSRTPQSAGKRFYMEALAGTPLKRKREDDAGTTSSSKRKFATPAFLRRSFPLAPIDEEIGPARRPFRKQGLVRSLSSIIQGLKRQEEQDMDDEMDMLDEMEQEEHGGGKKIVPKILVQDSQAPDMPLGPDQADESDEDSVPEGDNRVRKPWKKKGLKRQTRRVIMRPVLHKAGKEGDEEAEEQTEDSGPETQPRHDCMDGEDAGPDFHDDQENRDPEERTSGKKTKEDGKTGKKKKVVASNATKAIKDDGNDTSKNKKPRKVNPDAHANFRKLKIKNKNSKANGRGGRFGRR